MEKRIIDNSSGGYTVAMECEGYLLPVCILYCGYREEVGVAEMSLRSAERELEEYMALEGELPKYPYKVVKINEVSERWPSHIGREREVIASFDP